MVIFYVLSLSLVKISLEDLAFLAYSASIRDRKVLVRLTQKHLYASKLN